MTELRTQPTPDDREQARRRFRVVCGRRTQVGDVVEIAVPPFEVQIVEILGDGTAWAEPVETPSGSPTADTPPAPADREWQIRLERALQWLESTHVTAEYARRRALEELRGRHRPFFA